jgi:hypothetical protein
VFATSPDSLPGEAEPPTNVEPDRWSDDPSPAPPCDDEYEIPSTSARLESRRINASPELESENAVSNKLPLNDG